MNIFDKIPHLPVEIWAEQLINWLNDNFSLLFDGIAFAIESIHGPVEFILTVVPPSIVIIIFTIIAILIGRLGLGIFVLAALLFIGAMGYWEETMITLSLVVTSTIISLIVGIPVGILKAHSKIATHILDPILDFMQTMPLFVYLIPAVLFFSIGNVPGIVATFIFATPPAVRLTSLGIEQISKELKEAGHAFGTSKFQFLTKVELPLALPSIMVGINQTILLSLSMVVVASMIGAEGLGQEVLRGITRLKVGQGIASGIGIVLLAMVLDRISKKFLKRKQS
jgi:ABC-type proline/glycine betaine transport system permease subunit